MVIYNFPLTGLKPSMSRVILRVFFILFGLAVLVGCDNNPLFPISASDDQSNPAKRILINNGRYDKPYTTLGHVEYTLKRDTSFFVDQSSLRTEAIDYLKNDAFAKYGNKVDAIIDTSVQESTEEGYDGTQSITHVEGTAISFIPEKTSAKFKDKRKFKPTKKTAHKGKPLSHNKSQKDEPDDIEITPSEILK